MKGNRQYLTPTHAARAARCMHAWHLECFGDPSDKAEPDAGLLRLIESGQEHEQAAFKSLSDAHEVKWDGEDWDAGQQATVELMKKGAGWIYQKARANKQSKYPGNDF